MKLITLTYMYQKQVSRNVARIDRHRAERRATGSNSGHERIHHESRGRVRDTAVGVLLVQSGGAEDGAVRGQRLRVRAEQSRCFSCWLCFVLLRSALRCLALLGVAVLCFALLCFALLLSALLCLALLGIAWHCLALRGIALHCFAWDCFVCVSRVVGGWRLVGRPLPVNVFWFAVCCPVCTDFLLLCSNFLWFGTSLCVYVRRSVVSCVGVGGVGIGVGVGV